MSAPAPESFVWRVALDFLTEAELVPAASVPRMAIHAAYYAMFHGARAVLLKLDGLNAPTKRSAVVGRFGYHAKVAGDALLMAAGRSLNDAQDDRITSDYGSGTGPQPFDAVAAVGSARIFLEVCARVHGFVAP